MEIQYTSIWLGGFQYKATQVWTIMLYTMFTNLILFYSESWEFKEPRTCFNHLEAFSTNWSKKATSQHYISSTMNAQELSRNSSTKRILTSKLLRPTTMPSLPLNPLSNWPSTTPLPLWKPSTRTAQFNFGANSFPRSRSPSISHKPWGWIQKSQHTRHSMADSLTGTEHPLHPLDQGPSASYLPPSETRSNTMLLTHGI